MDWVLLARVIAIALCALCGVFLSTSRYRQWSTWSPKTQDHWWALCGWTFLGAYDTLENLVRDEPAGGRLVVLYLVAALTLRALLRSGEVRSTAFREVRKKDIE